PGNPWALQYHYPFLWLCATSAGPVNSLFRVSISLLILEILIAEKDNMSRSCCRCLLTLSGLASCDSQGSANHRILLTRMEGSISYYTVGSFPEFPLPFIVILKAGSFLHGSSTALIPHLRLCSASIFHQAI
ncbi:MAG: hypothetical protein MUC41_17690, partial [Syntrophobacteraceae bacterium]|nr:hypothetical protein [Syntrophobacteraceae bacterium]